MTTGQIRIDRPIALVGMMGAGKSTIGQCLAQRLGIGFADSDQEIERNSGMSIKELFERCGEPDFRERERHVLATLVEGAPKVIATGGGAFANAVNRELLDRSCFTVWLDAPVHILADRLADAGVRPLLRISDPQASLQSLLSERRPAYALAQIKVNSSGSSPEAVVDRIVALLEERCA